MKILRINFELTGKLKGVRVPETQQQLRALYRGWKAVSFGHRYGLTGTPSRLDKEARRPEFIEYDTLPESWKKYMSDNLPRTADGTQIVSTTPTGRLERFIRNGKFYERNRNPNVPRLDDLAFMQAEELNTGKFGEFMRSLKECSGIPIGQMRIISSPTYARQAFESDAFFGIDYAGDAARAHSYAVEILKQRTTGGPNVLTMDLASLADNFFKLWKDADAKPPYDFIIFDSLSMMESDLPPKVRKGKHQKKPLTGGYTNCRQGERGKAKPISKAMQKLLGIKATTPTGRHSDSQPNTQEIGEMAKGLSWLKERGQL